MRRIVIYILIITSAFAVYAGEEDSTLTKVKVIEGKINPKSIVHSGTGKFFAQNMMYKHTITVYDRNFNLLKTISDKVNLNSYGFDNRKGLYRGSPVECTFTHCGDYAWVSNYNMSGGEEDEFNKPGCDNCHGTGVYDSSFVYKINTTTLDIEDIIKVGAVPKYLAATPDDKYVLVTNWSSSDLSVIDTEKSKEIKRIRVGTYPRGIEVDSTRNKAYVAVMGSDKIAVIDLKTFEKTWIREVGRSPRHLCLSPKNDFLYVSLNGEGVVGKVDLKTNKIEKLKTGRLPRSMVLSGDGLFLYVVNYGSDKLTKVRTHDMKIMDNISTNDKPIGITFDNETKNIWVACYEGSIMVFHDSYYDSTKTDEIYLELLAQNSTEIEFRKTFAEEELGEKKTVVEIKDEEVDAILEEENLESKIEGGDKKNISSQYFLVAGSFKNADNAYGLVKDLKGDGYESFVYHNSKNDFTYACVESCLDKIKAFQRSKHLKDNGINVWIFSVR